MVNILNSVRLITQFCDMAPKFSCNVIITIVVYNNSVAADCIFKEK